jgi:tRNA threonylcarbamoyladenosine biosynthesis protein TsaE
MLLRAESLEVTHAIAAAVAGLARSGDLIVLAGDMGAGKTAFAQGFGARLGVVEPITSPTFTLVHSYDCGKLTLHHADLYRLDRTTEVADLALAELAEFDGIVLVEWGDVAGAALGEHLEVRLDFDPGSGSGSDPDSDSDPDADPDPDSDFDFDSRDEGLRMLEITPVGSSWAHRWDRLTRVLEPYRW